MPSGSLLLPRPMTTGTDLMPVTAITLRCSRTVCFNVGWRWMRIELDIPFTLAHGTDARTITRRTLCHVSSVS